MKTALTSSSGTLHTATNKINRQDIERSQILSVVGSNQNVHVRLEIRNQVETSMLCTAISRSALEMVYAEVVKKLQHHEEEGCRCKIRTRFLLPCSHEIVLGQPIDPTIPVINNPSQDMDSAILVLLDPPKVGHNRRTYPILKMEDTQENEREAAPNPMVNEDNEDFLLSDEDDVAFEEIWADAMSALSR
ncbi:hypothetical protein V1520DRAFT_376272 [Lipomyces starkeyi]